MTQKRFIPIFDGTDKRVVGAKDNGKIISFMDMFDLLNALHEENTRLKEENKQLNHDLDLYEENNTNEVLNNLRIELTSRMNDCIEEFKI